MKKNDKEKWIDDVFDSVKGSERAKPSKDLFGKILNEIDVSDASIIPLFQLRMLAAAAIVLLVLNIAILRQNVQNNNSNSEEWLSEKVEESVISNYNIYAE